MLHLNLKKRSTNWLLILIVLFALSLRLYGLRSSVTDWHAFRQADTASVTREYVKHGIDLLHPRFHDYGNVASGKDNPEGYRMVEFPVINALIAAVLRVFPFLDLVTLSRLTSVLFSLGTVTCLYFLGKRWANTTVGYLSALTFAVLPYAIFYSRVILPEPFFIFFLSFTILSFDIWLEERQWKWYLIALGSFAVTLLLKPFGLFFAPVLAYLALRHFKQRVFVQPALYLFGLSLLPLWWWRSWIAQYPEGIPASDWLFNSLDGNPIRFRPAWLRWLGWERYTKMILGGGGVIAAVMGIFGKNKLREVLIIWSGCVLLYLTTIAAGNVRHDYYQTITLPLVSLAVGQGLWIISQISQPRKLFVLWTAAVALISVIAHFPEPSSTAQFQPNWLLIFTWGTLGGLTLFAIGKKTASRRLGLLYTIALGMTAVIIGNWFVRGYYHTRPDYELAGAAVDRLTPLNAKVIAPAFGDTILLFQTNRTGWALGFEIEDKIEKGATYYVSTAYDDEARALEQQYTVVEKTDNHIIIKLTP